MSIRVLENIDDDPHVKHAEICEGRVAEFWRLL